MPAEIMVSNKDSGCEASKGEGGGYLSGSACLTQEEIDMLASAFTMFIVACRSSDEL